MLPNLVINYARTEQMFKADLFDKIPIKTVIKLDRARMTQFFGTSMIFEV